LTICEIKEPYSSATRSHPKSTDISTFFNPTGRRDAGVTMVFFISIRIRARATPTATVLETFFAEFSLYGWAHFSRQNLAELYV